MKIIYSTLEFAIAILAITAALAFGVIRNYLISRKLAEWHFAYINPSFFTKYIESTKKETGKIGIWFWILIGSITSGIFLGFVEGALHLFVK